MSWCLLVVCIWLTGVLILQCPALREELFTEPEAFAVGVVFWHSAFLAAGLAGYLLPWWLPVVSAVPGFFLWLQRRPWHGASHPSFWTLRESLFRHSWMLLPALLLLLVLPTLDLPLFDWDARILWGYKAKLLASEGLPSVEAFADPYRLHIHPRYPLLFPWLAALLARSSDGFQEFHLRWITLFFAVLTLWHFYLMARREIPWKQALCFGLILLMTGSWAHSVVQGGAEIILALFGLLAVGRLCSWLAVGRPGDLWMAGIFLAGALMTKNEGMLLLVAVAAALPLAAVAAERTAGGFTAAALVTAWAVLLSSPWLAQRALLPAVSDENYPARLTLEVLRFGLERSGQIGRALLGKVVDWRLWHIFWPSLLFWGIVTLGPRLVPARNIFLLLVLVFYCAGIGLVYLISPWREIGMLIDVTFDRIMLPVLVLGLLFGVYTVSNYWRSR